MQGLLACLLARCVLACHALRLRAKHTCMGAKFMERSPPRIGTVSETRTDPVYREGGHLGVTGQDRIGQDRQVGR
jgi:hypothetical protein